MLHPLCCRKSQITPRIAASSVRTRLPHQDFSPTERRYLRKSCSGLIWPGRVSEVAPVAGHSASSCFETTKDKMTTLLSPDWKQSHSHSPGALQLCCSAEEWAS